MHKSRGTMGFRKHGRCGIHFPKGVKSPKMRLYERIEAEKNVRRRRRTIMYASMQEAFAAERGDRW